MLNFGSAPSFFPSQGASRSLEAMNEGENVWHGGIDLEDPASLRSASEVTRLDIGSHRYESESTWAPRLDEGENMTPWAGARTESYAACTVYTSEEPGDRVRDPDFGGCTTVQISIGDVDDCI